MPRGSFTYYIKNLSIQSKWEYNLKFIEEVEKLLRKKRDGKRCSTSREKFDLRKKLCLLIKKMPTADRRIGEYWSRKMILSNTLILSFYKSLKNQAGNKF